jgi:hypothetical protein
MGGFFYKNEKHFTDIQLIKKNLRWTNYSFCLIDKKKMGQPVYQTSSSFLTLYSLISLKLCTLSDEII